MLPTKEIARLVQARFDAFESGDPVRVLGGYDDDIAFWDTRCTGPLIGRNAVGEHVAAFLRRFDVRFALLEEHRLEGQDAAIVLWECAVRRRGADGSPGAEVALRRGMNLLRMKDGLVDRDESYLDLASLDTLADADARPETPRC